MTDVPAVTPETIPVDPTVALALLDDHVPPPASVNAVVLPAHTVAIPAIAAGFGFMVTTEPALQPVAIIV